MDLNKNIEFKKIIWKKKENIYCNNCGRIGHTYKKCYEPILSYGIICIDLNNPKIDEFSISKYKFPNNIQQLKNICIIKYIQKNISCNNKKDLDIYDERILKTINIIMVRRKFTFNYIYLVKGLYTLELENIIKSINLITHNEYNNLLNKDFKDMYLEIYINIDNQIEYNKSLKQFYILREYILPQIKHKINIMYDEPEWGFPKGKRINNESNLECAIREFEEETSLTKDDYTLLDRLFPLVEVIKGTDGLDYKHIYYIAILNNSAHNKNLTIEQNYEIGMINSLSIEIIYKIIRNYNIERIDILNNLKTFLIYNIRYLEKFYHEKKLI